MSRPPSRSGGPRGGWERPALLLAIAGLTLLAWSNRFLQDDAFISFRYAHNLVSGAGLVFNPGEPVEGYTNFLWTLLVSAAMALGIEPSAFAFSAGLLSFVVSLAASYRLARTLLPTGPGALAAVCLLGTNYTFSCYATGGLETSLQAALLALATVLALAPSPAAGFGPGRGAALSLTLAAAVMTRPDSLVVAAVLLTYVLARGWRNSVEGRGRGGSTMALLAPLGVLLGGWLGWKLAYYGDLLPNTFHAKVSLGEGLRQGLSYTVAFGLDYFLLVLPLLVLLDWRALFRSADARVAAVAASVALWVAAVIAVGGDFMEFRFFVPILPLLFPLLAWACFRFGRWRWVGGAFVVLTLVGSLMAAQRTRLAGGMETIRQLSGHLRYESQDWDGIGRLLGATFGPRDSVVIATTAAGALPYYSRLITVDQHGLCDPWVARHGETFAGLRGHRRIAPLAYLERRSVNLVFGSPGPEDVATRPRRRFTVADVERFRLHLHDPAELPADARVVAIPFHPDYDVLALYLTPSPAVERAIRERGWQVYPIAR